MDLKTRRIAIIVAALVAAAIVLIWALGGFEQRGSEALAVGPGTEIDAGNLVLRLESATLQDKGGDYRPWELLIHGQVRNPSDEDRVVVDYPLSNISLQGWGDKDVQFSQYYLGPADDKGIPSPRKYVPPDDEWTQVTLKATFDAADASLDAAEVRLLVQEAEFGPSDRFGYLPDSWSPKDGGQSWQVTLPLELLPTA
ncbi:MAG: hypothetical protein LBR58_00900 [Propionibacteriaceae bacterium]|jgi:hypothetical protein|nr:hypothetical protein [Propionibacteriaceae bacterium]